MPTTTPTPQTIALVAVAIVFLLVILWRVRPVAIGSQLGPGFREALRKAQAKVEGAKDDATKAAALCDAADACAIAFGRSSAAVSYYLRAARLAPTSDAILERAVEGLKGKPKALETFLWRRIAQDDFAREPPKIQARALRALADVYAAGRKGKQAQADALRHLATLAERSETLAPPTG